MPLQPSEHQVVGGPLPGSYGAQDAEIEIDDDTGTLEGMTLYA